MTMFDNLWLTTLEHVKLHRDLDSTETNDDEFLKSLIVGASMEFVGPDALNRIPLPYVDSLVFDALGDHIGYYTLDVPDLLAVTTLTNGDSVEITSSEYVLESPGSYPKWRIRIKQSSGVVFTYSTDWEQAISLDGLFGYMPHYASAFTDTGVDGTLAAASTTSMDIGQNEALFEVGQYLRMESEYLRITAKTDNTAPTEDTLTLVRGQLGTTAAAHTAKDIETFQPLSDIREAVRSLVAYRYQKRNTIGSRVTVFQGGSVEVQDLDPSVQKTLDRHRRGKFWVGVV